jgi:MFS family permease
MSSQKAKNSKKQAVPVPPDGGFGWLILASCFVITFKFSLKIISQLFENIFFFSQMISFVADGVMYSFGFILNGIKEHFNATQEVANLLSSLNTGFLFCSGPIVSGLSNQFGIRPVVMGGALITASMYVASAYLPSIYYIMVAYGVVGGIFTGCTYIASLIIVAQYFDKLQGVATGITMAGRYFPGKV